MDQESAVGNQSKISSRMDQQKGAGDAPQLEQTNEQSEFDKLMENKLEKTRRKYKKALEMANKNIADLNHERDLYKNDLAVANEEMGNLKIQLKKVKDRNEKLKVYIRKVQSKQDDENEAKEKYKNDLAVANEEIGNLKIQLKNKEEELKKSKDGNETLKDYIRQVQSQQDDGQQIESVASVVKPNVASSTNNLNRRSDTSAVPKASSTNNFDKFDIIKNRRRECSRKGVDEPDDDCGLVIDKKKRPSNDDGSPTSLKRGNGNNGKRKIKERFETHYALVEETPQHIKRRNNRVEMTRIEKDVLKKDHRFFGSESESEGETQVLYCLKCPKSFDSKKLLKQHMEIHVNTKIGEEPEVLPLFNCSLCEASRSYHNAAGIFAHIESKHTSQKVMNCSFRNCFHQVKESNKQDLLSHIRSKHTHEKLFRCNECAKDFSTYPALKDHEKKHASGKQCNNCLRFYTMDNCHFCSKKK